MMIAIRIIDTGNRLADCVTYNCHTPHTTDYTRD